MENESFLDSPMEGSNQGTYVTRCSALNSSFTDSDFFFTHTPREGVESRVRQVNEKLNVDVVNSFLDQGCMKCRHC